MSKLYEFASKLHKDQLSAVVLGYCLAWFAGVLVSFLDPRLPLRAAFQVTLIFSAEFVLLALGIVLIDRLIKISRQRNTPQAGDIEEFARQYGWIFILFLVEYVVIIITCGLKYWTIFEAGQASGVPTFAISTKDYLPGIVDWLLYSAENVVPTQHSGVAALSAAARVFSFGQLVGNLIITIFLLKFVVSFLRFESK